MSENGETAARRGVTAQATLPDWLDRYTTLGLYGLLVGTGFCLVAFVTNPVPDPSFPWATLPPSFHLPFEQPRIKHWPVTYTVGIWLWIAGFPALFLSGYRRYGPSTPFGPTTWLAGLPTLAMFGLTTYCRFFWPKLYPATWNAPSYTFVCWLYCSSYDPVWSNLAYAIATLGAIVVLLGTRYERGREYGLAVFGVLSLPLGVPVLYEAYRRRMNRVTDSRRVSP